MSAKELEIINLMLMVVGILAVFFAGYLLETEFILSCFLMLCGIIVLSVKIEVKKESE